MVIGIQVDRKMRLTDRISVGTGWMLIMLGLPVSLLGPVSGGWSLLVIGVYAPFVARQDRHRATGFRTS